MPDPIDAKVITDPAKQVIDDATTDKVIQPASTSKIRIYQINIDILFQRIYVVYQTGVEELDDLGNPVFAARDQKEVVFLNSNDGTVTDFDDLYATIKFDMPSLVTQVTAKI